MIKSSYLATAILALPLAFGGTASAQAPAKKPNIIMIMADDVGIWNISAYHRGMMGGRSSGRGANIGPNGKATTATAIAASWAR